MVFSSLTFICVFLPVIFTLYYIIPSIRVQNGLLIIASLIFYSYGEPVYVLLMIGSAFINYLFALWIDNCKNNIRKMALALDIILNVGVLIFFKYTGMIITSVNRLIGTGLQIPDITLPLGISFFTFQIMSYVIDVYRKTSMADKNPFNVLLYISFFPQLIAGPIVKYHDISEYFTNREKSIENVAEGFRRFCCGLSKKVLISNVLGAKVDEIYSLASINAPIAWLGAIGYCLQIYFDFSGYSDMAIGLGKMFGFKFPENFIYPYAADSIKDFWRRWHITLSSWFKEYLYIPLGGNRKGKLRTGLNRLIIFFCTGLWHGANWTFVIWGLYHGFFSVLEEYVRLPKKSRICKVIKHIYALVVVCVGFVIFRADTITQAVNMIKAMFSAFYMNTDMSIMLLQIADIQFIVILLIGIIAAMPIKNIFINIAGKHDSFRKFSTVFSYCGVLILLMLCMISLAGNGYNPFIYFRF